MTYKSYTVNPLTDMCPGRSKNSLHQTSEQLNPMNGNVPFLDGAKVLSNEQTALYKDIAEVFNQNDPDTCGVRLRPVIIEECTDL